MGKAKTRAKRIDYKKATEALVRCVMLTLHSGGKVGMGSGMLIDLKTRKVERWEIRFFDALDLAGVEIDRDHYFANVNKKKRKR